MPTEIKMSLKKEAVISIPITMTSQEQKELTLEEKLIKCIKNGDQDGIKQILGNRALFNTLFTEKNYNLTMLILEHGSTATFLFYLNLVRGLKKVIKFTQRNTVFISIV